MSFPHSAQRAGYVVLVSIALAACSGNSSAQPPAAAAAPASQSVPTAPVTPATVNALPDFAPLVQKYGPAVVNVGVVQQVQTSGGPGGLSPDDPLNDFFRRFGIPTPDPGQRGGAPQPMRGEGSGFIVTPDGYILTNAHVVADADQVTVKLTDRREFQAKVIGVDVRTDVAVIKINAQNLPTVTIGDAEHLRPGEWVLAIGSPFGFENSATAGIVSATSRSLPSDAGGGANYVPFIQTDVAVNPGNSGGPLFNMRGEVVGINSQIFSRTGGYMGLSFAIPIDVAMDVREQLVKTGKVTRGRIGVAIQPVNAQFAESFGLDRPHGALVSSVVSGGPAEKAGIKPGDVILAVNGKVIDVSQDLPTVIARMKPGTEAELTVWRGGKEQKIQVRTDQLDEPQTRTAGRPSGTGSEETSRLGLSVRPLTPQEKEQAETDGSLVVEQVNGPAAAAGVQPGDVILGINSKRVKSMAELQAAAKAAGKTAALLIQRQDAQIFVPLRLN
jgi:serine protease Do